MRVLTKKLLGHSLPNLDMLLNWSWISTLHTQPNLALYQVFPDPDLQPSGVLHSLRITLFLCSNHSEITIYCRVISTSQDVSGSTSGTSSSSFSGPIILCLTTISDSAGPSGLPISQTLTKHSPRRNRSIASAMTLVLEANSSRSSS